MLPAFSPFRQARPCSCRPAMGSASTSWRRLPWAHRSIAEESIGPDVDQIDRHWRLVATLRDTGCECPKGGQSAKGLGW